MRMMSLGRSPALKALLPCLLLFGLLRLIFWLSTFPNPDEAYYWLWGQHPDFSYYDHPPLQAWVQGIVTSLVGRSFFALRLPNLLSNGIFFYTYYRIAQYLYGQHSADYFWQTIALLLASPLYFLFLALAWHDHWLITFGLIAAFQFILFLDGYTADGRGQTRQLYGAAVALGLALLCKYNAVFIGLGCLLAIATHPQWRSLLRDRRLYLAGFITCTLLLPVLIWNVTHDFQSFRYYSDRSLDDAGFRLKIEQTFNFIGVSLLMVSPFHSWAIVRLLRRPRTSPYEIVGFWIFAVSTLCLMAVSLVSTALYYWNILAYLLLLPLLPTVWAGGREAQAKAGRLTIAAQGYGLLFALLLVVHYSVIPLSVVGPPASDPDSRLLFGWDQAAAAVEQQTVGLNRPFIVTTDYRSASALAYQLNHPEVLAISDRVDQFDFWLDADALKGRDAVIVADDWHPFEAALGDRFEQVSEAQTITVRRFGIFVKNYYILRGYSFQHR